MTRQPSVSTPPATRGASPARRSPPAASRPRPAALLAGAVEPKLLQQLNFHHLYYFWRVARAGRLTQVASDLHLSQSALSTQIQKLEQRLSQPLFERRHRQLNLTEAGALVFAYAENIFGLGQELLTRLTDWQQGGARLRVGAVATLSRNYLENWCRPLLADEGLHLSIEADNLESLIEKLLRHELDVVLSNEAVSADAERPIHCRFLDAQPISLVGPAHHKRPKSFQLPRDLHGQSLALPSRRHALRGPLDALFLSQDIAPRIRAEVDDMAMLRLIARDNGWLTIVPEVVVQDELKSGQLRRLGSFKDLKENFYAISSAHRHRLERLHGLAPPSTR